MSTRQSTIDYLLEQMEGAGVLSARKMFGEYALYCDTKVVALVCDEQLFVKPTAAGNAFIGNVKQGCPYPGAKLWFLIPGDKWDDAEWLSQLIKTSAIELPPPKKKTARKSLKAKQRNNHKK